MCASCAAKQQAMTYAKGQKNTLTKPLINNEVCKYTFEEIALKLVDAEGLYKSYLKSALNLYEKNCNMFNKQLDEIFNL
jgi:hypothetical protein